MRTSNSFENPSSGPASARRWVLVSHAALLLSAALLGLGCSSPGPTPANAGGNGGEGGGASGASGNSGSSGNNSSGAGGGSSGSGPTLDPGPRTDLTAAGEAFPGLNAAEQALFDAAKDVFAEVDSVSGTLPEEEGKGLGPTFNGSGCAECHAQPDVGGSSPSMLSKQVNGAKPNPQVDLATRAGATNTVPTFITADGPIREARFKSDGGVHGLFTIRGRTDAPGCNQLQPDFPTELANDNVVFRIPTPLFGLGLVENTPDSVLIDNLAIDRDKKQAMGIGGTFNTSGNDGTITRFGWKAQNKSLLLFAGEAYNVEQGVSNEFFTNERSVGTGCAFNPLPEDSTHPDKAVAGDNAVILNGDVISFALFMRLSAPPTPLAPTAQTTHGSELFVSVGCGLCHSPTLTSGPSRYTAMSNVPYHPYSDIALHHMGSRLADGIPQGGAGPDMFRTAPLWGAGQRIFFLHDGRTSDLGVAIAEHDSPGSEAHTVISNFNALSSADRADVLAFIRSL